MRISWILPVLFALACERKAPAVPLKLVELQPVAGHPAGGKVVQIVGSGFDPHSTVEVRFGDKLARAIVVAKDRIQIESPPGTEGDEVSVTVQFPDGRHGVMPQKYRWETPVIQGAEHHGEHAEPAKP
jgi:hypothetical protein